MKLRLPGIRKGSCCFFNMVLVLVTARLVLSNIRSRNVAGREQRGFYSKSTVENQRGKQLGRTPGSPSGDGLEGRHPVQSGGAGGERGLLFGGVFFKGDYQTAAAVPPGSEVRPGYSGT